MTGVKVTGLQDLTPAPGLSVSFNADRIGEDRPLPAPAEQVALGATELPPQEPATLSPDGLQISTPPDGGLNRTTLWVAATRP